MAKACLNLAKIQKYLETLLKKPVTDLKIIKLAKGCTGLGYALDFKLAGQPQRKILKTLFPIHLGQDYVADRAQALIMAHRDYNLLAKHIPSLDVCGIKSKGDLISIGQAEEFFILMEEAKGHDYFSDLIKIGQRNYLTQTDKQRIIILANYLAQIHSVKKKSVSLYQRKIRDTIGSGASIMGVLDMYPRQPKWLKTADIQQLVEKSISFWLKDRFKTKRLCQIHGDFHPGNIFWQAKNKFIVLDRARGQWGEAADDIAALVINNIFFSLIYHNNFSGGLADHLNLFLKSYLKKTKDNQILKIIQPYLVFRIVVVCNPCFYPDSFYRQPRQADQLRAKLILLAKNILNQAEVDFKQINHYLKKAL